MNWRPFTLPATLPVTRIFSHYPTRTLPEVKKPYPSQPDHQHLQQSPTYIRTSTDQLAGIPLSTFFSESKSKALLDIRFTGMMDGWGEV